jgi:predicted RecB family nuclease
MVHKIAEEYVNRKDPDQWHDIVAEVQNGHLEIEPGKKAPKLDAEYARKFPEHLKHLRSFTNKVGFDLPGHTEYKFKYDLNPPHEWLTTGFIDRIIIKGDQYFIVDYKTTKKGSFRKNSHTILKDTQLRMYAKVVQRDFGAKPENISCALFYLDGGDMIGAKYTQQSIDEAEAELREAYRQVIEADPETVRGRVGNHCQRCDFRGMCKFYSLTDRSH